MQAVEDEIGRAAGVGDQRAILKLRDRGARGVSAEEALRDDAGGSLVNTECGEGGGVDRVGRL